MLYVQPDGPGADREGVCLTACKYSSKDGDEPIDLWSARKSGERGRGLVRLDHRVRRSASGMPVGAYVRRKSGRSRRSC